MIDWLQIEFSKWKKEEKKEEFNSSQSNLLSRNGPRRCKYNCIEINIYYIVSLLLCS